MCVDEFECVRCRVGLWRVRCGLGVCPSLSQRNIRLWGFAVPGCVWFQSYALCVFDALADEFLREIACCGFSEFG